MPPLAAGYDDAVAEAKPTLQTEDDRFSENSEELAFSRHYLKLIKVLQYIFHGKPSNTGETFERENFFLISTVISSISRVGKQIWALISLLM